MTDGDEPAFPSILKSASVFGGEEMVVGAIGISVRDYFVGQAMTGCAGPPGGKLYTDQIVTNAELLADEYLRRRKERTEKE